MNFFWIIYAYLPQGVHPLGGQTYVSNSYISEDFTYTTSSLAHPQPSPWLSPDLGYQYPVADSPHLIEKACFRGFVLRSCFSSLPWELPWATDPTLVLSFRVFTQGLSCGTKHLQGQPTVDPSSSENIKKEQVFWRCIVHRVLKKFSFWLGVFLLLHDSDEAFGKWLGYVSRSQHIIIITPLY